MDINMMDENGRTIINLATQCKIFDLIRLLLDHNADLSIQDQIGWTALMNASICIPQDDEFPIINMLLERMNMVDQKNQLTFRMLKDILPFTLLQQMRLGKSFMSC